MINITHISNDYNLNSTQITVEVYERLGTIERCKDKFILTVPKIVTDMQEIEPIVDMELTKNGLNPITFKN